MYSLFNIDLFKCSVFSNSLYFKKYCQDSNKCLLSRKNCHPKNFNPRIAIVLKSFVLPWKYLSAWPGHVWQRFQCCCMASQLAVYKCFSYCFTCFIICFIWHTPRMISDSFLWQLPRWCRSMQSVSHSGYWAARLSCTSWHELTSY